MMKRIFAGIILVLLLTGILALARNVQPVRSDYAWTETIYIRADGSVYPDHAPISSTDNVTYTLTDNIVGAVLYAGSSAIVIERGNIVVDGAGYMVEGTEASWSKGIDLTGQRNVTIKNMEIKKFYYGIRLDGASNNSMVGNNITANNWAGISLIGYSSNNTISGNNITNNGDGVYLSGPSNNSMVGNNITANNWAGVRLDGSSNNTISGNNITANNSQGIYLYYSSNNTISGNNITNNGCGIDLSHSSYNSMSGNNIANNGYGINIDYLYSSDNNIIYHNNFIDNVYDQVYSGVSVNVWDDGYPSGGNYWSDYGGTDVNQDGIGDTSYIIDANNTDHYPLMVPYVIPEFPSFLVLPLFMITTLLAVTVYRRRMERARRHSVASFPRSIQKFIF